MSVNERIKIVRKTSGLTQSDFGKKFGYLQNNIARLENGNTNPDVEFIQKLYNDFEININWLLTGEGEMYRSKNLGIVAEGVVYVKESYKEKYLMLLEEVHQLHKENKELRLEIKRLKNLKL